jgi:hypothetical protein
MCAVHITYMFAKKSKTKKSKEGIIKDKTFIVVSLLNYNIIHFLYELTDTLILFTFNYTESIMAKRNIYHICNIQHASREPL